MVALADVSGHAELKAALAGTGIVVEAGEKAVCEAARRPSDFVMAAIVGAAGLKPTLAAVERGAVVALANKECLVSAGDVFMAAVSTATARPCCRSIPSTAPSSRCSISIRRKRSPRSSSRRPAGRSGLGPIAEMRSATPTQAVAHPNVVDGRQDLGRQRHDHEQRASR